MLTRQRELARKASERAKRIRANADIAIYNRVSSMKCNPFAGDTTVLDRTVDNRTDNLPQTEDELLDSLLHPRHNFRVRKSDVRLVPEMVSEEIKDWYKQKIGATMVNNAKLKRDKC